MTHFAIIAPPFPSHVRALESVASHLVSRGHRLSWLQQADARQALRDPRIGFVALGASSHPPGSLGGLMARAAAPGSPWGLRRVIQDMAAGTRMLCRELSGALRSLGAEAVLADPMEAAGALVARGLGLPYASLSCAMPLNREPGLPLAVMPWRPAPDAQDWRRRVLDESERVYDRLMAPLYDEIEHQARGFGLGRLRRLDELLSPRLQLSQMTRGIEFPLQAAPRELHYTGPWRRPDEGSREVPWPAHWRRRPEAPLVFASLGTMQGGRLALFRRIARACRAEGMQLVIAHCGLLDAAQAHELQRAGADWVTDFVPQPAMLAHAQLAVTHAGINTVMDCLAAGTPMLALPLAFDQPGTAARVAWHGAGLQMHPRLATTGRIRRGLRRLLEEAGFAERALALGRGIPEAGGAPRAADLIEAMVVSPDSPTAARPAGLATVLD
ncbi:glycosyltransferase [Ramlibacter rhizophilus]|uniref:Glycosyltransferase n=1 Tax=Ramlibacter rhizophilus TaxID=1781167 RepID=A0A4Z0BK01_9BURK|nr:glycosyltransferase [Ramlibacter rhizophilus]TFY98444.1 glycosyltransferase [Ramlibacter rhizophilus]